MSDPMDLEGVIEDSVNDALAPEPTDTDFSYTPTTEDTDGLSATPAKDETAVDDTPSEAQVPAPGATTDPVDADAGDAFAKRFGLQSQSITGRENRIPYSRVKKIVERAEKEAIAKAKSQLETAPNPKFAEIETKVKDYEGRLEKVAQFEHMIEFQPREFLNFLSTIPAYKDFFDHIQQLSAAQAPKEQQGLDLSQMPQPDQPLPDGTAVYSHEGLRKLLEWQAQQVEARAIKQAEDRIAQRYKPMEDEWQREQRRQAAIPVIQKQIADARQWPGFTENEAEIIEVLKADPNITLEGAYRKVAVTKMNERMAAMQPDRDKMRQEILDELRRKPASSSVPATQVRPASPAAGKRSLEDIIQEAANSLKQ
jgi:hypothetical protein